MSPTNPKSAPRAQQVAVDAAQADGAHPRAPEGPEDLGVELPGEDHLDHVERALVGDAAAVDDRRVDAEPGAELGRLLAATVHDDDADADLRAEGQLLAEGGEAPGLVGDLAAELHDEGLRLEAPDEREGLAQHVDVLHDSSSTRISFCTCRRFSASS